MKVLQFQIITVVTYTCELFVISMCKCTVCVNTWCAMYNLIWVTVHLIIPIELNFSARGSLIPGLETNDLINWPTGRLTVRFYNPKQRTTSRMPHFSDFFTETNNKPHHSDAAKISYVVFFVLEVTTALQTTKISSSIMVGNHMKKPNILFPTSASLE